MMKEKGIIRMFVTDPYFDVYAARILKDIDNLSGEDVQARKLCIIAVHLKSFLRDTINTHWPEHRRKEYYDYKRMYGGED